ncbi:MAG: AmmeMemoRadiSam system protein A [Clostridiaceae bacterium]|nr:AmmeMemoRadiSam system protein A [Clostridiaceae bacterium]
MGEILKAFFVPHPPLIIPDIGNGEESRISSTIEAYHEVGRQVRDLSPDVIILTTPHGPAYSDYIHISPGSRLSGSFKNFGAPRVKFEFNSETGLIDKIVEIARSYGIEAGGEGSSREGLDHGALVPLYFVSQYYTDFTLIRISIAGLSLEQLYIFGYCIQKAVLAYDKKVILIGSGDLSHRLTSDGPYGFAPEGPVFDKYLVETVKEADFKKLIGIDNELCYKAGECGLRSFAIIAGALNGLCVKSNVLSYEGPFGVGYMVAELTPGSRDLSRDLYSFMENKHKTEIEVIRKAEDPYVALARQSLEYYVKKGKILEVPDYLPAEMINQKKGVFVSIKKYGQLRGCIGTISPVTNSIAEEIIQNAVSAGTRDPRFNPVKEFELKDLVYSVDVLEEPEPINSIDELDVKRYGVIVTSGYKRGLLLPDLESIETPAQQVEIALSKAGISKGEKYSLERFEVVRHR